MAFDPTKPQENTPLDAAEMRSQLNALNDNHTALAAQVGNLPTPDDVTDAILNNSAANVNAIAPLTLTIGNPPTQAQVTAVLAKVNELIGGLYR